MCFKLGYFDIYSNLAKKLKKIEQIEADPEILLRREALRQSHMVDGKNVDIKHNTSKILYINI